jgi:hypothetical protein
VIGIAKKVQENWILSHLLIYNVNKLTNWLQISDGTWTKKEGAPNDERTLLV